MNRRELLLGALAWALPRASPIRLGVASYSLRELSRSRAIAAIRELGTPFVNIKSFHAPYDASADERAAARAAFEDAGLTIVGGGTIDLKEDTDEHVRFHFDYARALGMPLMVVAPTAETLPRIERFVEEYDIAVAVHNHGPEDAHFPGPQDVMPHVEDMDPRVGLCVDAGHTARTGVDVADAVRDAGPRVLDVHMKDLKDLRVKESQCVVGEGAMPLARIFSELKRGGYSGYVNLEYEIDAGDPLPGMKKSFANMRAALRRL